MSSASNPRRSNLQFMSMNDAVKGGKFQPEHAQPYYLTVQTTQRALNVSCTHDPGPGGSKSNSFAGTDSAMATLLVSDRSGCSADDVRSTIFHSWRFRHLIGAGHLKSRLSPTAASVKSTDGRNRSLSAANGERAGVRCRNLIW